MHRLNAIDAIAPAFTRTQQLLFQPFRLGRSWKLAATQYLALMGSIFVPFPLAFAFLPHAALPFAATRVVLPLVALVLLLVFFGFFYVGVRLSFVSLEMVVSRQSMIAPMWRHYGARVWPWIWLKVLLGTILTAILLPVAVADFRAFLTLMAAMPVQAPGAPPDPRVFAAVVHQIVPLYGLGMLVFGVIKLAAMLLDDFALPAYLIEPINLTEAIRIGVRLLREDFLGALGYLAMKILLAIVGFVAQYIVNLLLAIPVIILFVVIVFVAALLSGGHHNPGMSLLSFAAIAVTYLFFVGYFFWTSVGTFGCLMTFLEAYGLYFVGSRYPPLGNLLEPPPPMPFTPPPSFPSPEEKTDKDDDPPLPMDPALA